MNHNYKSVLHNTLYQLCYQCKSLFFDDLVEVDETEEPCLVCGNREHEETPADWYLWAENIKTKGENEMKFYTNICDRYGDECRVTIFDYEELNPYGNFEEWGGEIREHFSDTPGDYEVIAIIEDN